MTSTHSTFCGVTQSHDKELLFTLVVLPGIHYQTHICFQAKRQQIQLKGRALIVYIVNIIGLLSFKMASNLLPNLLPFSLKADT